MAFMKADSSDLSRFARRLVRESDKEIQTDLRKSARAAGNLVRDDARSRTDSVKAQKSLRVGVSGATVTVTAGSKAQPLPKLLEGDGTPGTFRHPLFGNKDRWYEEARKPYLHPALEAKRDQVTDMLGAAGLRATSRAISSSSDGGA